MVHTYSLNGYNITIDGNSGSIYALDDIACHQFVGQDEFIIGNVFTGIHNNEMRDQFMSNNILSKEKCRDCWAKLFCSGGCHANAYFSNGSIVQPNELACTLQKKRIECAVMIQALMADEKMND